MESNCFSKILILTSCIFPNTFSGNISNFSPERRAKELILNCNYMLKKQLFDKIIIIDGSQKESLPKKKTFKDYLFDLGLKKSKVLYFYEFNPDINTQILIKEKGKGFSETKMILNVLENFKYSRKTIFYKLSGRYLIKNIEKVILDLERFFSRGGEFAIPVSNLFERTNSVMYIFSSNFNKNKFEEICKKVSDNDGLYVEHLLYSEVFLNSLVNTSRFRILPIYPSNQEGGSCQGKYTLWRQLKKNFIHKYF